MTVNRPPDRWLEFVAAVVIVLAAAEELTYMRHRAALAARRWWEEVEHRDHYGAERSALGVLVPRILMRRVNR